MLISSFFKNASDNSSPVRFNEQVIYGSIIILTTFSISVALIDQHFFEAEPCQKCIVIRSIIVLLSLSSIIGMFLANSLLSIVPLIISGILAWKSYENLFGEVFACGFGSPFPNWLPLSDVAPWLFEVRGLCGDETGIVPYDHAALGLAAICFGLSCLLVVMTVRRRIEK